MNWSGEERRALDRGLQEDVAYLRRRVKTLSRLIGALALSIAAVIVGGFVTWVAIQHARAENKAKLCSTVDETRSVFSDFIKEIDPLGKAKYLQKLKARLDVPACGDQKPPQR